MRRIVGLVVATITLAGLSFLAVRGLQRGTSGATANAGRPAFIATLVEKRYDTEGNQIYEEYLLRAFRSDAWVELVRREDPAGKWVVLKTLLDQKRQVRVVIDPPSESTTTYALTKGAVSRYSKVKPSCTDEPNPQTAEILGYTVVRVRGDWFPPGKGRVWERWLAPALACFPMRETFTYENGKPSNIREATFIVTGEPPAVLFDVPRGYKERSPSEVFAELKRRYPSYQGGTPEVSGRKLDEVYRAEQPKR